MKYTAEDIDNFLDGTLEKAEMEAFQQELDQDQQLLREVDIQRELRRGILNKGNEALKDRLRKIHEEELKTSATPVHKPEKGKIIRFNRVAWAVAATILLLVAFFVFFPKQQQPEALFAQYYEPYEISLVQRGNEAESLAKADNDYRVGNYAAAIPVLEELLQSQPANAKFSLILGICYLEIDQASKAREYFQLALNNSLYQDKAQWYLALSYLKEGRAEEAKEYLEILKQDQNSSFRERATQLLEKIFS